MNNLFNFLKKHRIIVTILVSIMIIICAVGIIAITAGIKLANSLQYEPDNSTIIIEEPQDEPYEDVSHLEDADTDATANFEQEVIDVEIDNIYNIMLIGLDTRAASNLESSASTDVMILLTIDEVHNKIKMTSFMRDTLVQMPNGDMGKLNAVFYNEKTPEALLDTITRFYGIQVDDYAIVNFSTMASIVDILGGVVIDIKSSEIGAMNTNIDEQNRHDWKNPYSPPIAHSGENRLNGVQTVAYCRIRKVSDGEYGGDYGRVERQKRVLDALVVEAKDITFDEIKELLEILPDFVRTNISATDILKYAKSLLNVMDGEIEHMRLPTDETGDMTRFNGRSVIEDDFEQSSAILLDFIYEME